MVVVVIMIVIDGGGCDNDSVVTMASVLSFMRFFSGGSLFEPVPRFDLL